MVVIKRQGYIYESICTVENCKNAILKASENKKHSKFVSAVLEDLDEYARKLATMLKTESYEPSPYIVEKIYDGLSKKERVLYKPKFYPDQCVHWALMLQMEKWFMKPMYPMTCGSIKKRGTLKAMQYVERWVRTDQANTKYCLKADIRQFYKSCRHDVAKSRVRAMVKDPKVIHLFDVIIDSVDDDVGIPLGNYTSQWLGNAILTPLDHYIKEVLGVKYYVRYADDIVLFGPNKKTLHKIVRLIENFLNNIHLKLKNNWQVFHVQYYNKRKGKVVGRRIDFCGYAVGRYNTKIRKRIMKRMKKVLRKLGEYKEYTYEACASFIAYNGWLKYSDSYGIFKKYIKHKINIKRIKQVIAHQSKAHIIDFSCANAMGRF